MLFQQDGAAPHFHKEVTHFLNRKFPEKWFGRGGLSLGYLVHLTLLLLIFLLGYIKNAVYVPPLATTLPEFAGRLRDAVATVTLDLLNNMWTETE
jgi:hypothetical protein